MGSRSSFCDEGVANATGERQVSNGFVQMAKLSAAEPELEPAEAVVMCRHALPARDRSAHRLARCAWRQDLDAPAHLTLVRFLAHWCRRK